MAKVGSKKKNKGCHAGVVYDTTAYRDWYRRDVIPDDCSAPQASNAILFNRLPAVEAKLDAILELLRPDNQDPGPK